MHIPYEHICHRCNERVRTSEHKCTPKGDTLTAPQDYRPSATDAVWWATLRDQAYRTMATTSWTSRRIGWNGDRPAPRASWYVHPRVYELMVRIPATAPIAKDIEVLPPVPTPEGAQGYRVRLFGIDVVVCELVDDIALVIPT